MIYTSYFRSPHLSGVPVEKLVAISIKIPPTFRGQRFLALAPTMAMLKMESVEYYKLYDVILAKLDPHEVGTKFEGCILLCWEKDPAKCHRSYVGQWLICAGFQCQELSGGSLNVERQQPLL